MVQHRHKLSRVSRHLAALGAVGILAGAALSCAPEKPSKAKLEGGVKSSKQPASPQDKASIEASAVAVINGEAISFGEFNRRVRELPEFARVRYATVSQQQEWLDSVAQFEVMADVAEKKGLGAQPEVYWALKRAMAEQLLEDVVREEFSMDDITEEAIEAYYQAHRAEFERPEARRVVLIEVATREEAARIRKRVLVEMDRAEDSAINAFRRAAAAYSTDRAVGIKGGDIGFIPTAEPFEIDEASAHEKRARIARAIAPLEQIAELTPVFALDPGWALATFIEERPAAQTSRDEAAGDIRQILYKKRREKIVEGFIADLRQEAEVKTFPEVIESLKAPPEPSARDISEITLRKQAAFGVQKP